MRILPPLVLLVAACTDGGPRSQAQRGAELYAAVCARCHGQDGSGGVPVAPGQTPRNFRDPVFQAEYTDGDVRKAIVLGKPPGMPAFGTAFKAEEIDALVAHVRTFGSGR